jgi:zeaxanthin glucosyltransferase
VVGSKQSAKVISPANLKPLPVWHHTNSLLRDELNERKNSCPVPPIQGAVVPRLFSTMKIGFICPNLPGHINPMSALARHLRARGHDVVFLYLSSANGLPCIPGDKRDDLNANRPEMSQLEGNEALAFYCGVAAKETEAIFKSWPRMLEKTGVEALVLDPIQFFVELAAMKLRIPYVTVANALYIDFSGYTPAGIFGWPHENTPDALARNLQAVTEAVRFCYNEGIKSYAKELGFKDDLDHPSWIFSELAYITQLPKEFDFEHPLLPPQFHYTGPFHDGKGRHPVDFPWDRLTGEPLIYASMGTIMNGRADVFRNIATGVANHRGTQLVLSIGDRLDPKTDRTGTQQRDYCQPGIPVGIAEASLGLHHSCRVKHRVGISCSGCASVGDPSNF